MVMGEIKCNRKKVTSIWEVRIFWRTEPSKRILLFATFTKTGLVAIKDFNVARCAVKDFGIEMCRVFRISSNDSSSRYSDLFSFPFQSFSFASISVMSR
jgi:hypothetical protein